MLWLLASIIVILFAISVIRGAPYVPTHQGQVEIALDMLDLKKGDRLVDFGSGDGRVLRTAAERGLKATGYEINPLLCISAWWNTRKYRKQVKIVWGDMWSRRLPEDTKAIFVFVTGKYMPKLEAKVLSEGLKNLKMVSYGYELPNKKPLKQEGAVILYKI